MTTKKSTPQNKATDAKEVSKQNVVVPSKDTAVQNAKVEPKEFPKMDDSKESKDAIKKQKDLTADIHSGKVKVVSENTPATIESLTKPLVPHEITGKMVHETAEDFYKAQAAKGKL